MGTSALARLVTAGERGPWRQGSSPTGGHNSQMARPATCTVTETIGMAAAEYARRTSKTNRTLNLQMLKPCCNERRRTRGGSRTRHADSRRVLYHARGCEGGPCRKHRSVSEHVFATCVRQATKKSWTQKQQNAKKRRDGAPAGGRPKRPTKITTRRWRSPQGAR